MDIYNIEDLMDDLYSGRITRETFRHKMQILLSEYAEEYEQDYAQDYKNEYDRFEKEIDDLQKENGDLEKNYEDLEDNYEKLDEQFKKLVAFLILKGFDPKEIINAK